MNKFYRMLLIILAVVMVLGCCAGCGDTSSEPTTGNQGGEQATDPTQGSVSSDIGTGENTAVFHLNDGTDAVYTTVHFEEDARIANPGTPEREGYFFKGWYEDAEFTKEFNFNARQQGDKDIYARWLKKYTFEAEYTQFTDLPASDRTAENGLKIGYGYSSNVKGTQLIMAESTSGANSSNGYYVSNLYYNGAYLEFVINSDAAVEDAVLILRLTAEFYDMYLTDENYLVMVNDEEIAYGNIDLTGAITDLSTSSKRPFSNYTVSSTVSLVEGENIIRLQVNNDEKQGATGTMNAIAPMVDCIYVYTDAALTWEPLTGNIG